MCFKVFIPLARFWRHDTGMDLALKDGEQDWNFAVQ
jgi:hypothetical protein